VADEPERDRPIPERPDPVDDLQEESSWSGYTRDARWPSPGNRDRRGLGGFKMPDASEWVGIAVVVIVVLLAMWGLAWLVGQIFS
jgi:hypothetical protein